MRKRILVVTTLMLAAVGANAQQDMALTHFMFNKMSVNPGETGIDDGICGNLIYRNQWDKVNGAPNSFIFNTEANLPSLLKNSPLGSSGVGLTLNHDAIGFNRQTNVMLNYSQHIDLPTGGTLGIGVGLGMFSFGLNPTWVPPTTLNDASLPANSSAMTFDVNFGLFYKQKNWYAGLSSTHLTAPILEQKSILGTGTVEYNGARHYYFMGGYTIDGLAGGRDKVDIQMLGQTDAVKTSVNLNARYIFNNFLYGGLAFRNSDAVSVLLGWKPYEKRTGNGYQSLWIGYSYDLTIGKISNVSNGTHEMLVKFCYVPIMKVTKAANPRYL